MSVETSHYRSRIAGVGAYLPKSVLSNRDLEEKIDTTDSWITERTGIRERRIAAPDEAASDLAVHAANGALESAKIKEKDLDLIIVATATPDMLFPSTACLVQGRLAANRAVAFDLSAACSGFVYALQVGDLYIRSGLYQRVLVIGTEVMSRIVDWSDRSTCILFGDGAGAVVLIRTTEEEGILSTHLHSDGRLWDLIQVPGGGSRVPPSPDVISQHQQFIKMKGSETFKVAVRAFEDTIREAMEANRVSISDIDLFVPHQANIRIIEATIQRLNFPRSKVMINLDRYGNTSAASIPIALEEAVRSSRLKKGDLVLLATFGSGLTWSSALLRW